MRAADSFALAAKLALTCAHVGGSSGVDDTGDEASIRASLGGYDAITADRFG